MSFRQSAESIARIKATLRNKRLSGERIEVAFRSDPDVIASVLPYERYVAAEAVLSLSQVPGPFGSMFRSPEQARATLADLRRAQAEAEVRCF